MKSTNVEQMPVPPTVSKETQLMQNKALGYDILKEIERLSEILRQVNVSNEELTKAINAEAEVPSK